MVKVVRRATAAFRISVRTTSSRIRALCANRSANWSRAAASGIFAATTEHFCQKASTLLIAGKIPSSGGAVKDVLQIRFGLSQLVDVVAAAVPANRRVWVLTLVQDRNLHLEPFGEEELSRSRRGTLTCGVRVETEDHLATRIVGGDFVCRSVTAVPQVATTGP